MSKKEMMNQMMQHFMEHHSMSENTGGCQCEEHEGCCCRGQKSMPVLGMPAPAFKAESSQGPIDFPADYEGKWVILFSHPGDFTPVCTTELLTFAARSAEFEELNCELIGLSVDSNPSHIAWLRTITEKIEYRGMKAVHITFPVIEDTTMKVSHKYGMIHPGECDTKTIRAVFFIDPKGIVRSMIYYPLSLGRNFDEIKRVLLALQTTDNFGVSTPADWHPGDDVIVPSVKTYEASYKTKGEGVHCQDWFFCTKPISKDHIWEKIRKK